MPADVSFFSEGARIAAHLYRPEGATGPCPAIVLCHGFAGFKEMLLPPYAERFARAGYVALTFDYRGFGASEGEPGRLVPAEQIVDIRNALRYVRSLEDVDAERLGLWGTSFGGANAVHAAALEPRVRAVVVQLTFASGRRIIKGGLTPEQAQRLDSTLASVIERTVVRNKVMRVAPDQILSDEESKAFFARNLAAFPQLQTKIPFSTIAHVLEHNAEEVLDRVRCPLLVIGAKHDGVCPPSESEILFARAHEPKQLVMLDCRHFDAYEGEALEQASGAAAAWFRRHVTDAAG